MKLRYLITSFLFFMTNLQNANAIEWIAHRGASASAPENTLSSFLLAWQQGISSVECDVLLSQDKKIVVIHDPSTSRTTNASLMVKETPWQLLSQLDAGSWKSPKWQGERIPLLKSLFELKPENNRIYVEIKDTSELIDILADDLQVINDSHLISIISFNYDVITKAKQRFPQLDCFWVIDEEEFPIIGNKDQWVEGIIQKAKTAQLDGLSMDHKLFKGDDIHYGKAIKDAGLRWVVWTVNDSQEAHRFIKNGIDAITTDDPHRLRMEVQQYNPLHHDLIADI